MGEPALRGEENRLVDKKGGWLDGFLFSVSVIKTDRKRKGSRKKMKKILLIIAEYNPFHNGHLYQMEKAKNETGADYTVVILSGNFVQRGEPAILDEETRARIAVEAGADLVLRNPTAFATASADYFAMGAVRIMRRIPGELILSFGSEKGRTEEMETAARLLLENEEEYYSFIRKELSRGTSFPRAREMFLDLRVPGVSGLVRQPNNILGVEYIKHIMRLIGHRCSIHTVLRKGAGYKETHVGNFMSATGIRGLVLSGEKGWEDAVPAMTRRAISRGPLAGASSLMPFLRFLISREGESLARYRDVVEGLENRIIAELGRSETYSRFITAVGTKRYTDSTIKRALLAAFLGLTKEEFSAMKSLNYPYIRVLGRNEKGMRLLAEIRKTSSVPFLHNENRYPWKKYYTRDSTLRLFRGLETRAQKLYRMLSHEV